MSTITPCTSLSRPTEVTGRIAFETDTKNIIVYDGTNWRGYANDGASYTSNSYSASFDGTNDYIDTNNKFDFIQQTCNFSISCWVKFTDHTSTSANQAILANNYTSSQKGFYLFYDNRFPGSTPKSLRILFVAGATASIQVNNAVSDNDWFHIAATCAASGTLKLYVDGSLIGSASAPSTTTDSAYHNLVLGTALSGGTTPSFLLNGNLDEVAIFNRELTSTEVSNIGTSKLYPQFTSFYRLENNANDESGTNNGTNNGATFVTSTKPY